MSDKSSHSDEEPARDQAREAQAPVNPALRPGRSGEGAASIIPHLREQEQRRKPISDH